MLRAGTTWKRWRLNTGNNPGQGTRIVSSIETPAFQLKFNKTTRKSNQGDCTVHNSCKTTSKKILMLRARGTETLFLHVQRWTEGGQARGEKIHDTPSIRLHHQEGGRACVSKQDGRKPVHLQWCNAKKTVCGKQRTMYFYLVLGKYGSYHRDNSSYVVISILYKLLTD